MSLYPSIKGLTESPLEPTQRVAALRVLPQEPDEDGYSGVGLASQLKRTS